MAAKFTITVTEEEVTKKGMGIIAQVGEIEGGTSSERNLIRLIRGGIPMILRVVGVLTGAEAMPVGGTKKEVVDKIHRFYAERAIAEDIRKAGE